MAELSSTLLKEIFETAPDAIVLVDMGGQIVAVNRQTEVLFGWERDKLQGQPVEFLIPVRFQEGHAQKRATYSEQPVIRPMGQPLSLYAQRADGTEVPVDIMLSPVLMDGRSLVMAVVRDATRSRAMLVRIEEQVEQLTGLREIDQAIASTFDHRITIGVVLDQTLRLLPVDAAAVHLVDPQTLRLQFAGGRGFRTRAIERAELRVGLGVIGRSLRERRVLWADLTDAETLFVRQDLLREEGFRCYCCAPLIIKGQVIGALEVFSRQQLDPYDDRFKFLESLAGQAAIGIDAVRTFTELQCVADELSYAYDATLEGWASALELRDEETTGHCLRVVDHSVKLAAQAGLPKEQMVHLRRGALLHDIGKMAIPDAVLLKPGLLTEEEWVVMRRHSEYGYSFIKGITFLQPAADVIYCHHEHWDGSGYPRGLKAEEIPLMARIFAVSDVWDALLSDRPYRRAWSEDQARDHIRSQSGKYLDPRMVDAFLTLV